MNRENLNTERLAKMEEKGEFSQPEPTPERVEGFSDLSPEVQKLVIRDTDIAKATSLERRIMGGKVLDFMEKKSGEKIPEGFETVGVSKEAELKGTDVTETGVIAYAIRD